MTKSRVAVFVAVALFLGAALTALVYNTIGLHQYTVESCITFEGRRACGTAAGATREEALRSAANIACSSISGGMTDRISCSRKEPDSVRWINE
jgi:hypothetical protein